MQIKYSNQNHLFQKMGRKKPFLKSQYMSQFHGVIEKSMQKTKIRKPIYIRP